MTARPRVSDLLHPDGTLLDVGSARRDDVLLMVAGRLAPRLGDVDPRSVAIALLKRENLMSTALSDGVAIPHARIRGVPHPVAAIGRSAAGVDWDAQDGGRTHVFVALVFPDDEPGSHLRVLAAASRLLHDPDCRAGIMRAGDAAALLAALRASEERLLDPVEPRRSVG